MSSFGAPGPSRPPRRPLFRFRWRGPFGFHFGTDLGQRPFRRPEDIDGDADEDEDRDDEDGPWFGVLRGDVDLYRRSFTKRIETGPESRLRVENRNGLVRVRTHHEPAVVVNVTAELYAESDEAADREAGRIERAITSDGGEVEVRTPDLPRPEFSFFGRGPKVDYDILVPAETEVHASNRNGPVDVQGTRRALEVENRNGRVVAADVGGDVKVENRNGRISLARCAGSVEAESSNGPISVEKVQGPVEVETRNGSLEIIEPGGTVKASSTNGSITFRGRVSADVDLEATNGAVRMAVTPDSRFEIDAESRHGSVRSEIPVRERPPALDVGPPPKVKIRTMNGSIRLSEL